VALTAAGAALTEANRAEQLATRAGSLQELVRLWSIVDIENLPGTINTFARAAAILAGEGFDRSAATAANYYGLFRRVEGVGTIAVPRAPRPLLDFLIGALRGSALKGIIDARKAGMSMPSASRQGLVRVSGELTKLVLSGGRMTITTAVKEDPRALGWARVTSGEPCAFCRLLASRGPIYKTEKSADFEAHDHDVCMPEAVFAGKQDEGPSVAESEKYLREYQQAQAWARSSGTMSSGTSNDALNNYRRWLANGSPSAGEPTAPGPANNGSNPA
jgi:hypothetical protein